MNKTWYSFLFITSPITKIIWGIVSMIVMVSAMGFQTIVEDVRMGDQTANWDGRSIEKGAELYDNNCSTCHGKQGQGGMNVAPPLNSKHFFEKRVEEVGFPGSLRNYIKSTVASGRPIKTRSTWANPMPTWAQANGGPLRADQVDHVVNFILNWEKTAKEQTPEQDPWDAIMKVPEVAASAAITGPRPPQQLFVDMACSGCHNIKENEVPGQKGAAQVGPNMANVGEIAGTRIPGKSAEDYIYECITNPRAFTVPDYQEVMPADYKDRMSEEEVRSLIQWLLDPNRAM